MFEFYFTLVIKSLLFLSYIFGIGSRYVAWSHSDPSVSASLMQAIQAIATTPGLRTPREALVQDAAPGTEPCAC